MDSLVIPMSEDGSRLDRCIRRILGNINQGMLEKHLRSGYILLDDKKVKSSEKVKSGQLLKYSEKEFLNNSTPFEYRNINDTCKCTKLSEV